MKGNDKISLASIYQVLLDENTPHNIIFYGGRSGGKTKNVVLGCSLYMALNPYKDVVYGRASYGSIRNSIYAEAVSCVSDIESLRKQFTFTTAPLAMHRIKRSGDMHFIGLGGGRDRTKGIKTLHDVGIAVFEELQELEDEEQLEQARSSLLRRMSKDGKYKMIYLFNPPNWSLHWVNQWCERKRKDSDWLVIKTSWEDVSDFLTDYEIKDILKIKHDNPPFYDYLYMGNPSGAEGLIYPMFNQDLHTITYKDYLINQSKFSIQMVVIGCDFAVNNDATVFSPLAILNNGQSMVLPIFYHDPIKSGVYGSAFLIENFVKKWFLELCNEFDLLNRKVPIIFSCDSASSDAIVNVRTILGAYGQVFAYKKQTIPEMVGVVQSTLSKNMVYILDKGYYQDYVRNVQVRGNPLITQLTRLAWNDKNNGYMPLIPNDATDSLTYAINMWYKNPFNMQYLTYFSRFRKDYYVVKEMLNK